MTDTRNYEQSTILAAARELLRRRASGEINDLDYVLELDGYRLRDGRGAYWFLDPAAERWYRFEDGRWRAHESAPDRLEAPELEAFQAARGRDGARGAYESRAPIEPRGLTAVQALAAIVGEIRSGFDDGSLSSSDARDLLARHVLVDLDGGFWTLGIRSRRWYRFEDRQWHRSDQLPPSDDRLFHLKVVRKCASCGTAAAQGTRCRACGGDLVGEVEDPPESVSRALPGFMLFGVTTWPESVTDAWAPPPSFPDEVVKATSPIGPGARPQRTVAPRCPTCGAAIKQGQKFCTQCGGRIAAAAQAP